MQKIRHILMLSILLCLSAVTWAGVTPQVGLWSIVSEATGQPGRGLGIDVQGDTLILTVYGYTKEGRATFYLASGPYADGKFSGELGMYGGGTALGEERVAAQYLGSAGTVSLVFNSEAEGTVTLPGEGPKAIARFVTDDIVLFKYEAKGPVAGRFFQIDEGAAKNDIVWASVFYGKSFILEGKRLSFTLDTRRQTDKVEADGVITTTWNWVECTLEGEVVQLGASRVVPGDYVCGDGTQGTYRINDLQLTPLNNLYGVPESQMHYSGQFYVKPQGSNNEALYIMQGMERYSNTDDVIAPLPPVSRIRPSQNGLWWTAVEANGVPGRGLYLDRQGNTLVLTFFGYDEKGQSIFYIASGKISASAGFSADLLMVEGGTAFGTSYVPGRVIGSKGKVSLRLDSDTEGVITLPGEEAQAIKRFTAFDVSRRIMQDGGQFLGGYSGSSVTFYDTNYQFFLQDNQFELRVIAYDPTPTPLGDTVNRLNCLYMGQYESIGITLHSNGYYVCDTEIFNPWTQEVMSQKLWSKGTYSISDLTVDERGIFSGNIVEDGKVEQIHIGSRYIQ